MAKGFARVPDFAQRRPWAALLVWVAVLVGVTAGSMTVGNDYRDDHTLPGSESQAVSDALATDDAGAHDTFDIVVAAPAGLRDPQVRSEVEAMADEVAGMEFVDGVSDPYTDPAGLSDDGTTAIIDVTLDTIAADTDLDDVRTAIDAAQDYGTDDLRVELTGDAVRAASETGGAAEGIGILAALLILIPLFGSVLAGSLPVVVALFAVGTAVGLIGLSSNLATIPSYAVPMMMLVGLGVGIDYALLIFSRFRAELIAGRDRDEAVRRSLATAGRSVLFAGLTVIVALLGLLVLGLSSLQGLALSVALVVLATMVTSVTLLPALLTLLGPRIERRVLKRAARRTKEYGGHWRRLADFVQDHPWPALLVSLAALAVLAMPALDLRLGFTDAGTDDPSTTSRQAYELVADGFGAGASGPLVVLAETSPDQAAQAAETLRGVAGVAEVAGPIPEGTNSTLLVFADTTPRDAATGELVERLREEVLPDLEGDYLVGGATAAAIDYSDAVAERLPWFIGLVVLISALLLMLVFRSVLIPIKAALLNLVSIAASMGVVTWVFGEGNLWAQEGPIEAFIPVLVFAVVFGLSMDYEVFLVSRMHEEWMRSDDARHAVREGLAATGGVITAAAAIMIVVFGAFVASPDRMLQTMGLGLAVAVFLDAVLIRCLVVPAVMSLLGRRAWWLPAALARILPVVHLEEAARSERVPEKV